MMIFFLVMPSELGGGQFIRESGSVSTEIIATTSPGVLNSVAEPLGQGVINLGCGTGPIEAPCWGWLSAT